jgi:hypothetical protein
MDCTPPHIYISLHVWVPALNNFTLLQFELYQEKDVPAATGPQTGLQGKHLPIVTYGPLPGNGPKKGRITPLLGRCHSNGPKKNRLQRKHYLCLATDDAYEY